MHVLIYILKINLFTTKMIKDNIIGKGRKKRN